MTDQEIDQHSVSINKSNVQKEHQGDRWDRWDRWDQPLDQFQKFVKYAHIHGFLICAPLLLSSQDTKSFVLMCLESLKNFTLPYGKFCDVFDINKDYTINDIRALLDRLHYISNRNQCLIIWDSVLTKSIANLLLKSVEEHEDSVYFFIISSHPYKIPVTLRSRLVPLFLPTSIEQQSIDDATQASHIEFIQSLIHHPPVILDFRSIEKDIITTHLIYLSTILSLWAIKSIEDMQAYSQDIQNIYTFFHNQDSRKVLDFWEFVEKSPRTWDAPLYKDIQEDLILLQMWFI